MQTIALVKNDACPKIIESSLYQNYFQFISINERVEHDYYLYCEANDVLLGSWALEQKWNIRPLRLNYVEQLVALKKSLGTGYGPLYRAIGKKTQKVVDTTLGRAQDSLLMLAFGMTVEAYERNENIFCWNLLAYLKACEHDQWKDLFINQFSIHLGSYLPKGQASVVFYDPMYNDSKRKTLPSKEMRFFDVLIGKDTDSQDYALILHAEANRLIVKRSLHAPPLLPKANMVFKGKSTRYDVYLQR